MAQCGHIGQPVGGEAGIEQLGELGFTGPFMGQAEQLDHHLTGASLGQCFDQPVEGAGIGGAREELIAVDQLHGGHWFAPQAVDHVPVIDHMPMHAIPSLTPTRQRHELGAADEEIEPVVIKPYAQAVPDQPGGHGVEHFLQREAAGRGDRNDDLLIVAGAPVGQLLQSCTFGIDPGSIAPVLGRHNLIDEAAVGGQIVKIAHPAQQQRITNRGLQMAMGTLDGAILVGDTAVIAGRLHAVMLAQRVVARGQVGTRLRIEIAERRREAVAAVLGRGTAQSP